VTLGKAQIVLVVGSDYKLVEIFWKKLRQKWRPFGQISHYVFRSGLMEVKNLPEELQRRSLIGHHVST
jgi:hypothetical protein